MTPPSNPASQETASLDTASLDTVARLHQLTTAFHVFIYFAPEVAATYAEDGLEGMSGYFATRTAAMGPLPSEMVIATFYNFNADHIVEAMDGMWDRTTPQAVQQTRWKAAARFLDAHCGDAIDPADLDEALALAERSVAGLRWEGRPLAAGNHAALAWLDASPMADHKLLRLWQLVTIIREWRGDAHIGLLVAEPLTGPQCTVVSHALKGGFVKASRGWDEARWDAAVADLVDRGYLSDGDTMTEAGLAWREDLEARTNALAAPIWAGFDDAEVNRFGDLLEPLVTAVIATGALKPVGLNPPE